MASDKFDFSEFLNVLEAKRAALDALIASYRAAMSVGALGQLGDDASTQAGSVASPATLGGPPIELPTGAFLGKSLPAAIKLYLSAVRKKQTIREIAAALREGGVESTAANFEGPINGALYRLKAAGDVFRFKDGGWGLSDFYPESLRTRIAKDGKPKKEARSKRKKIAGKRRQTPKASPEAVGDQLRAAS